MKRWLVSLCCLAPLSCFLNPTVSYVPQSIIDPAKVIERVMTSQPPEYAGAVPFKVSVTNVSIQMWMPAQGNGGPNIGEIYYNEIGKVVLKHTDVWYVEILDRSGVGMYNVFSRDEIEAKQFMDALYTVGRR